MINLQNKIASLEIFVSAKEVDILEDKEIIKTRQKKHTINK